MIILRLAHFTQSKEAQEGADPLSVLAAYNDFYAMGSITYLLLLPISLCLLSRIRIVIVANNTEYAIHNIQSARYTVNGIFEQTIANSRSSVVDTITGT